MSVIQHVQNITKHDCVGYSCKATTMSNMSHMESENIDLNHKGNINNNEGKVRNWNLKKDINS